MSRFTPLSLNAQTAFAELFDVLQSADIARTVGSLKGSFSTKLVKGRSYYYFQYREIDGKVKQIYVGPESDRVKGLIESAGKPQSSAKKFSALAKSAQALGCTPVLGKHFSVINRLGEYGFFKAGGVLIGTHAFLAMGNMLGVKWLDSVRTQDVDFAHAGNNVSLALPSNIEVKVTDAIESLSMGLLPMGSFKGLPSGLPSGTYTNPNDPELRIDFLTSRHRGAQKVVQIPNLQVSLQPLSYMEFSLEDTLQTVVFSSSGAAVVNIPAPARYALHKLIIAGERSESYRTKSSKDVAQAAAILSWLLANDPEAIGTAWADLISRGKKWRAGAERGVKSMSVAYSEIGLATCRVLGL